MIRSLKKTKDGSRTGIHGIFWNKGNGDAVTAKINISLFNQASSPSLRDVSVIPRRWCPSKPAAPRPKGELCRRPSQRRSPGDRGDRGDMRPPNGKALLYLHHRQHLQVSRPQCAALNAAHVSWFGSLRTSVVSGTNAICSLCSQRPPPRTCLGGRAIAPASLCPAPRPVLPPLQEAPLPEFRPSVPGKTRAGVISRGKRTKHHQEEEQ